MHERTRRLEDRGEGHGLKFERGDDGRASDPSRPPPNDDAALPGDRRRPLQAQAPSLEARAVCSFSQLVVAGWDGESKGRAGAAVANFIHESRSGRRHDWRSIAKHSPVHRPDLLSLSLSLSPSRPTTILSAALSTSCMPSAPRNLALLSAGQLLLAARPVAAQVRPSAPDPPNTDRLLLQPSSFCG